VTAAIDHHVPFLCLESSQPARHTANLLHGQIANQSICPGSITRLSRVEEKQKRKKANMKLQKPASTMKACVNDEALQEGEGAQALL
jgi:hypothetical protein